MPSAGRASSSASNGRPERGHPDLGVAQVLGGAAEPLRLERLGAERLDDEGAVEALVGDGRDVRRAVAAPARPGASTLRWYTTFMATRAGKTVKPDQRQPQVGGQQPHDRQHDDDDHAGRVRQRVQHLGGGVDVAAGVGEQLAGRVAPVEGVRHLLVAAHDLLAQRGLDAGAGDRGRHAAHDDAGRLEQADADDEAEAGGDGRRRRRRPPRSGAR